MDQMDISHIFGTSRLVGMAGKARGFTIDQEAITH